MHSEACFVDTKTIKKTHTHTHTQIKPVLGGLPSELGDTAKQAKTIP
jgi:hypothetical protein